MANVTKILNLVLKILAIIALIIVLLVSLATAYIVFAPDSLPKPFYLTYSYPTLPAGVDPVIPTVVPTATPPQPIDVDPGQGIMVNTGSQIINLSDPTGKRYLKTTIVLEFAPTDENYLKMTAEEKATYITNFTNEITPKLPVVDDSIITLISTKTFDDLYTADGKANLRNELLDLVNRRLPENKIISIYFTEFVVQ